MTTRAVTAVAVIGTLVAVLGIPSADPTRPGGRQLVDSEDFTGSTVDTTKWSFDRGLGYGPVLLLWPESNRWPRDGELDSGQVWGDFSQWHVYAVDWRHDYVKISVDGRPVYDTRTSTRHSVIPNSPMHLVVQQDPGPYQAPGWIAAPNASTPDHVVTHVAWVRMYR